MINGTAFSGTLNCPGCHCNSPRPAGCGIVPPSTSSLCTDLKMMVVPGSGNKFSDTVAFPFGVGLAYTNTVRL